MPKAKLKCEVERAISRGQCPPYIQYFVSFDAPKEKRLKPAILRVKLQGDDLDLRFSFSIMEEMCKCLYACCGSGILYIMYTFVCV